jgi:hypothetical protein
MGVRVLIVKKPSQQVEVEAKTFDRIEAIEILGTSENHL